MSDKKKDKKDKDEDGKRSKASLESLLKKRAPVRDCVALASHRTALLKGVLKQKKTILPHVLEERVLGQLVDLLFCLGDYGGAPCFDENSLSSCQLAASILSANVPVLTDVLIQPTILSKLFAPMSQRWYDRPRTLRQHLVETDPLRAKGFLVDLHLPDTPIFWSHVALTILSRKPLEVYNFVVQSGEELAASLVVNFRVLPVARFLVALLDQERELAKKRIIPPEPLWSHSHEILAQLLHAYSQCPGPHVRSMGVFAQKLISEATELYWPQRTIQQFLLAFHARLTRITLALVLDALYASDAFDLLVLFIQLCLRQVNRAHVRLLRENLVDAEMRGYFTELFHPRQSPLVATLGAQLVLGLLTSGGNQFVPVLGQQMPRLLEHFFAHPFRSVFHAEVVNICAHVLTSVDTALAPVVRGLICDGRYAEYVKSALLNRNLQPAGYYGHLHALARLLPEDNRPWDWGTVLEAFPEEHTHESVFVLTEQMKEQKASHSYVVGQNTFGEE